MLEEGTAVALILCLREMPTPSGATWSWWRQRGAQGEGDEGPTGARGQAVDRGLHLRGVVLTHLVEQGVAGDGREDGLKVETGEQVGGWSEAGRRVPGSVLSKHR